MKYAEFYVNSNNIEFKNSVFGVEYVVINGTVVSRKFSLSGTKHSFRIDSKNYTLESDYKQFKNRQVQLYLKENGKIIDTKSLEIPKQHRMFWLFVFGIFGFKLGQYLIELFNQGTISP